MPESAAQHRHIDRAEQLESAARLTARERERNRERQALFFEGPEDIGKSSLLLEIYERHSANGVYFVDLSRMAAEHEVLEVLAMQAHVYAGKRLRLVRRTNAVAAIAAVAAPNSGSLEVSLLTSGVAFLYCLATYFFVLGVRRAAHRPLSAVAPSARRTLPS